MDFDSLRAWMVGGAVIGVGKVDLMTKIIHLDEDVRFIVMNIFDGN